MEGDVRKITFSKALLVCAKMRLEVNVLLVNNKRYQVVARNAFLDAAFIDENTSFQLPRPLRKRMPGENPWRLIAALLCRQYIYTT